MNGESLLKHYKMYLQLERNFSTNTIDAYLRDAKFYLDFLIENKKSITDASPQDIANCLKGIVELGLSDTTQARILSGIKAFYQYCIAEQILEFDASELVSAPKQSRKLPLVMSLNDIEKIFEAMDYSKIESTRNRAILETMYSCGLRVSEVVNLQRSKLHLDLGFIRVIGKGNKERLVPIGSSAIKYINLYLDAVRNKLPQIDQYSDYLFISKHGKPLSRIMIHLIIKQAVELAGLDKSIHAHTFRHSFATHLVEGGADIRAVQEMLGHASITTTEIYTHLDKNYLRETLEKFHPRF